jgi:hypothetical protein
MNDANIKAFKRCEVASSDFLKFKLEEALSIRTQRVLAEGNVENTN